MTKRQDLKEADCVTVGKGATGDLAKNADSDSACLGGA